MGSAIAHQLVASPEVELVRLCDARPSALDALTRKLDDPKVRPVTVDARDRRTLTSVLADSDCVIGCSAPEVNPLLASIAVQVGSHYCDLGSSRSIVQEEMKLSAMAKDKGVWIVPGCGLDPGLVHILCQAAILNLDIPESGQIWVGDVPRKPEPPFNFRIGWSADKLIDDYTNAVTVIEDGELVSKKPLTEIERLSFGNGFGNMEAFFTAGDLETLWTLSNKTLKHLSHKSVRWPGHAEQMAFLLALGFGEKRAIDAQTHLTYRDVLARRLKQRLGGPFEDVVLARATASGIKDGKPTTCSYELVDLYHDEQEVSAIQRCTGIPAASIAILLASGAIKGGGTSTPECIVPIPEFLKAIQQRGLQLEFKCE
jgi:lysine 6-dehydrogenase